MKKNLFNSSLLLLILALGMQSCKKEVPVVKNNNNTQLIQRTATLTQQVKVLVDGIVTSYGGKPFVGKVPEFLLNSCATLTIDSTTYPNVATLDYGTGCYDSDGTFKSGQLTFEYPDSNVDLSTPNTDILITFNNYVVDSIHTNGTLEFHNQGYNGNGNLYGTYLFNFTILNLNSSQTLTGTFSQNFERLSTVVEFTGSLSATDGGGYSVTQTVVDPLWMGLDPGCDELFIKGIVEVNETGEPLMTVDYGTGTCDNEATETKNAIRTTVYLD